MSQKAATADLDRIFWSSIKSIAAQAPDHNKWPTYERIKSLYQSQYPEAERFEYQDAMKRIARLVGV